MARLRNVKPRQAIKVFEQLGYVKARQRGSHISMQKPGTLRPLVIPDHDVMAIGTLNQLLKTAGISKDEFEERYNNL